MVTPTAWKWRMFTRQTAMRWPTWKTFATRLLPGRLLLLHNPNRTRCSKRVGDEASNAAEKWQGRRTDGSLERKFKQGLKNGRMSSLSKRDEHSPPWDVGFFLVRLASIQKFVTVCFPNVKKKLLMRMMWHLTASLNDVHTHTDPAWKAWEFLRPVGVYLHPC